MTPALVGPDFSSVVKSEISLPHAPGQVFLKFTFTDPLLFGYEVIVVLDSLPSAFGIPVAYDDVDIFDPRRLITIIGRLPRPVLAELNTHRDFTRNSASSRARSVKATIAEVMENAYIPLFTVNRKGMSGPFASEAVQAEAAEIYRAARDSAVGHALQLLLGSKMPAHITTPQEAAASWEELVDFYYKHIYTPDGEVVDGVTSIHKQNVNRLLEPFLWHEVLLTSSKWSNFLELRDHDEAQGEIHAFARLVREALEVSTPQVRPLHAPFVEVPAEVPTSFAELRPLLMLSATEAAQISYKDKSSSAKTTATSALGERLLSMKHLSPFEHVAFAEEAYLSLEDEGLPQGALLRSNFSSDWVQLRHILSAGDFNR
jgi:hypothetical protein